MSEAIGSAATSLGNILPSLGGIGGPSGYLGQFGNYMNPGNVGLGGGSVPYFPPPPTDSPTTDVGGMTAAPFPAPGTITAANLPSELPPMSVTPEGAPFSPTGGTPGMTGEGLAAGTPAAPSFWQSLFGGGGGGGGTGTAATGTGTQQPSLLASLLRAAPGGITDLLKYQQQRSLLDPSAMASDAQKMARINAAALRKAIFPQVTAQLQETGNINAPYLASQAYTTAIAPIVAQMQEAAMNQWLEANREAMGLYPGASDIGALGGLTNPSIFGGGGGGQ